MYKYIVYIGVVVFAGMGLQEKYWNKIEDACCIAVACVATLVKLAYKYIVGTYNNGNFDYDESGKSGFFFFFIKLRVFNGFFV